ncbi:MAG: hemerythrin family protein [Clostridiales bacterium]|nr:hemerythrin family protein [Clostridiales bacterium]
MRIVFDENLYTGYERIDEEHKELIARVNNLAESCEKGTEKLTAVKTLDFLMDYTEFHFADEEKLQQEIGYDQLEQHKEQHETFKKAVNELREMLEEEEGPTDAFVEAVNKNICRWLVEHIQKWDKAVADDIRAKQK